MSPKVNIERCTFFVEFMATQEHGTGNEGDSFKTCHLNNKQICLFKSGIEATTEPAEWSFLQPVFLVLCVLAADS